MIPALLIAGQLAAPTALAGCYTDADGVKWVIAPAPGGELQVASAERRRLEPLIRENGRWTWKTENGKLVLAESEEGSLTWQGPAAQRWSRDPNGYRVEQVRYRSDIDIAGNLFLPPGVKTVPGVVILHGSGTSHRGSLWYFTFADHLARNGIAVLLPDKRGSGDSGGDWKKVGFEALTADAIAGAKHLAKHSRVKGVGLLGMSQGGWIAPMAADRFNGVRFVVSVSAAAVPVYEQLRHEMKNEFLDAGMSGQTLGELMEIQLLAERYVRRGDGWPEYLAARERALKGKGAKLAEGFPADKGAWIWPFSRRIAEFDPLPLWQRIKVPSLILFGSKDERELVPVRDSVRRLEGLRNPCLQYQVIPDTGHAMGDPATKWVRISVLERIAKFIHDHSA